MTFLPDGVVESLDMARYLLQIAPVWSPVSFIISDYLFGRLCITEDVCLHEVIVLEWGSELNTSDGE